MSSFTQVPHELEDNASEEHNRIPMSRNMPSPWTKLGIALSFFVMGTLAGVAIVNVLGSSATFQEAPKTNEILGLESTAQRRYKQELKEAQAEADRTGEEVKVHKPQHHDKHHDKEKHKEQQEKKLQDKHRHRQAHKIMCNGKFDDNKHAKDYFISQCTGKHYQYSKELCESLTTVVFENMEIKSAWKPDETWCDELDALLVADYKRRMEKRAAKEPEHGRRLGFGDRRLIEKHGDGSDWA